MNIMQMMQNVQKMQKKLTDAQKELENVEVKAQSASGAVEVVYTGQGKFKSIKIKAEAINPENPSSVDEETIEMLEDLITEALVEGTKKSNAEMEAKMKTLTGGISIPGLF
ncbi:YbaB/EbfC family nucleoid-associated protein [bacterium]|nr:YbaB/EbfC family nucleoid-associated protein [bacterium]